MSSCIENQEGWRRCWSGWPRSTLRLWAKCRQRLGRLAACGHELRRPEGAFLRDGIYQLRVRHLSINYRILYFFHGQGTVVVSHGFTKQRAEVPRLEIELAIARRDAFRRNPVGHTYEEES